MPGDDTAPRVYTLELKPDCFVTGTSVQASPESSQAQDQEDPAKKDASEDCEARNLA